MSAAYFAVLAGGVKATVYSTHTLMTAASPLLVLPVTKPDAPPSLVDRRLIAQSAPDPVSQPLRRVTAMIAPEMPAAQLAHRLDEAETAYEPESSTVVPTEVTVPPDAIGVREAAGYGAPEVVATTRPLLLQIAALEIARDEFGQLSVASRKLRPKQPQSSASLKRKARPSVAAKARGPIRLAMAETPGLLMYRGFVKRQS